jgi:hypothetical protein
MGNKKKRQSENFWGGANGWQEVEVGEDFLLGSSEFGFMGLQVLDPSSVGKHRPKIKVPRHHISVYP